MQLPETTDIAQAAKAFECEEQRIPGWKSQYLLNGFHFYITKSIRSFSYFVCGK